MAVWMLNPHGGCSKDVEMFLFDILHKKRSNIFPHILVYQNGGGLKGGKATVIYSTYVSRPFICARQDMGNKSIGQI